MFRYDANRNLTQQVDANGVTTNYAYDALDRLVAVTSPGDAADNLSAIADSLTPKNNQKFQYDVSNYLKTAQGPYGSIAYSYDDVGNRVTGQVGSVLTSYGYAPNTNRLSSVAVSVATQSISYTATGNIGGISGGPISTLSYNQAGRLAFQLSGSQTIASYQYDADGNRLAKTLPSVGSIPYSNDFSGHLLEEKAGVGSAAVDYLYLDDGRPFAAFAPSSQSLTFLLCDRQGTPQAGVNQGQAVVWSAGSTPSRRTRDRGRLRKI